MGTQHSANVCINQGKETREVRVCVNTQLETNRGLAASTGTEEQEGIVATLLDGTRYQELQLTALLFILI